MVAKEATMKSITLRGIDGELEEALKRLAKESSSSVNATILQLLRRAVGLEKKKFHVVHHDLDALAGTWSEEELREFERNTRPFSEVDEELWT
jgi:hypothetical protein